MEKLRERLAALKLFVMRLVEECAMAFVLGAGMQLFVSGGDISDRVVLAGAAMAGGRAVLGLLAKKFGDKDKPSLSK